MCFNWYLEAILLRYLIFGSLDKHRMSKCSERSKNLVGRISKAKLTKIMSFLSRECLHPWEREILSITKKIVGLKIPQPL